MRRKLLVFMLIVSLGAAAYIQYKYDSRRGYFDDRQVFVTLPSGKTLRILSFGYQNLVADMLFIWAIQFYSNYYNTNMYDYLERVFATITDLTPRYKEPYIVGAWIMALEAKDAKMAVRLLEKGSKNMPEEWIFDYESGYYAYKDLKDYTLAEQLFTRAASKPSAPRLIERTRAHMVYMEDNLDYAYQLWRDIYNKAQDRFERSNAANHLNQIKYEMDKKYLEQRISQYKMTHGRYPHRLEDLQRAGLVKEIPKDFSGHDYIYDNNKGTVTASKVLKWKKSY